MGMQLPGGLATFLQDLGYNWPKTDEEKLFTMGGNWLDFAGKVNQPVSEANSHATRVWSANQGDGIQAFQNAWNDRNAPHRNLLDGTTGGTIIGAGLMICSAIVLTLKINVIAQLVQLAIEIFQAMVTAPETFGASLAEIPVFKEITGRLVNLCINLAMNAVGA
jgi:hypothetical protein